MTPLGVSLVCVFVQVTLTFVAIIRMGAARVECVKSKEVTVAQIALDTSVYPTRILQLQNNVRNQFETPILLYAAVAIGASLGALNWAFAVFAIGYVVMRLVHYVVHTTHNRIGLRFQVFGAGLIFLALMWVALGLSLVGIY